MELGASGKRPASVVGLVDRRYDDVLKGVDTEDDAAARKSFIKWRRKEYRTVQNELIRRLDEALPQDSDRTMPEKFSAGSLALGKSGRTLHLVLEDTLRHMRQDASIVLATRLQSTTSQQAMQSGPSTPKAAVLTECNVGNDVNSLHRAALMNSVSLIVIELENPWCWTIRDVGLGARRFFRDAPFSSIVGHSLAHLMRCEDMPFLHHMWPSSVSTKIEGRIHLIDFSAANCAPSPYDMSVGSKYESFCNFNTGNDKDLACFPVATPTPSSYMLIRASMILLHQSKLRRKEDRTLLIAEFGTNLKLPICNVCHMSCCFRTQQDYPLELSFQVQRPVFVPIEFQKVCHVTNAHWDAKIAEMFPWSQFALQRWWCAGGSRQQLADLLSAMPPSLDTTIKKVCSTIDVLVSYQQIMINKAIALQSYEQSTTGTWANEVDEFDVDDLPPEDALWRTKWHAAEQTREGFEMGKSMCKFAGMGYQELCVRASRCELPCPFNDVEWLASFIGECLQTFASNQRQESQSKFVRYHRMYGPERDNAFLVRITEVLKQDCLGRTVCTRYVFSPCSADEYDQAVRETPMDCRPLLGAMGLQDTRSGQALIDAGKSDFHSFKMRNLVQSPQGRAFLEQFAHVIETAMTPVFAAADHMEKMIAAHVEEQNALAVFTDASEGCPDARNEDLGWYKELRSQQHGPPLERIAGVGTS